MKHILTWRAALAALILATGAACSETAAETQAETQAAPQANSDVDAAIAEMFVEKRRSPSDRPDFTNETVLKLNPIVERSKTALDRYDDLTPQLAAAREAKDTVRIAAITAEFGKLKADADGAKSAFQSEKAALLARGEYYNAVVLAAMEQFVAEAPVEIAAALQPPAR